MSKEQCPERVADWETLDYMHAHGGEVGRALAILGQQSYEDLQKVKSNWKNLWSHYQNKTK